MGSGSGRGGDDGERGRFHESDGSIVRRRLGIRLWRLRQHFRVGLRLASPRRHNCAHAPHPVEDARTPMFRACPGLGDAAAGDVDGRVSGTTSAK